MPGGYDSDVRALVLILADLYLSSHRPVREVPGEHELEALPQVTRFARARPAPQGWRAWLCEHVGRADLAAASPGGLAAALLEAGSAETDRPVWLAEPVHLEAGLDRVRLAPRGLLALEAGEAEALAASFHDVFASSTFALRPLRDGALLLQGLEADAARDDPARRLGDDLRDIPVRGSGARVLQRLQGEIELWLYDHPVNRARAARRLKPVSALWIWGGGFAARDRRLHPVPQAYASEASVAGLWRLCEAAVEPAPPSLHALPGYATSAARPAGETIVVLYVSRLQEGIGSLERDWIAPALQRLARRELSMLTLVANDRILSLRRYDLLKRWRPRLHWTSALR
jgi:hypothetical protein